MSQIILHELIVENCNIEKVTEGIKVWCSFDKGYAVTPQKYKAPIIIEAEVMTDSHNIRLLYDCGQLILNWEGNEEELRWHDPGTGRSIGVTGAGKVPSNQWVTITWTIEEGFAAVSVDGVERYRTDGDFSSISGQIGIGSAMGSTVSVRRMTVTGEPTDKGTPIPEIIEIKECLDRSVKLMIDCADLSGSNFTNVKGEPLIFETVTLAGSKIKDANLYGLEIDGAGLGGAFFHNIGPAPEGHPSYKPGAKQDPVRFENCDFNNSTFSRCDLTNIEINDCNITGMKINGVLIEEIISKLIAK